MSHSAEPAIRRRIAGHARRFDQLVEAAERAMGEGRLDDAAKLAHQAGVTAWQFHPGFFASPRLERLLLALGRRALGPAPERPRAAAPDAPARVLHVLTQAARVGGHTKLAWRWIRHDTGRTHSVALTDQAAIDVPPWLTEAVAEAGGALHHVDQQARTPIARAEALRALARDADMVVLHAHPHDVVPVLALAGPDRPPVVLMNHADHVFWLGVSVADVVANIRQRGIDLCVSRRGIAPERCALLPIPLDPIGATSTRAEARARLGLPPEATILMTVAQAYKYNPLLDGPGFVETVLPVLQAHPEAMLVAIGPPARGEWRRGAEATSGRIRALGERSDLALFYQAADIYLESFPLGSMTALLEAGAYGLPLMSYLWLPGAARQMGVDDPALDGTYIQATSADTYREALERLIRDPAHREALGARTAAQIRAHHDPAPWRDALATVYARVAALPPVQPPGGPESPEALTEHDVYLEYLHRQQKIQLVLDALRHPSLEHVKLMWNRLRMYR